MLIYSWLWLMTVMKVSITEAGISMAELDTAASQLPNGKSPGPDGLTNEFYKYFWTEIRGLIYNAFKECIDYSILSRTMKQGIITLIPKPNKDKLSLDN